ncbi:MAG: hypothetical protein R3C32_01660 [Chloroflexota bacterium]
MACEEPVAALAAAYLAELPRITAQWPSSATRSCSSMGSALPGCCTALQPAPPVVGSWTVSGYRATDDEDLVSSGRQRAHDVDSAPTGRHVGWMAATPSRAAMSWMVTLITIGPSPRRPPNARRPAPRSRSGTTRWA